MTLNWTKHDIKDKTCSSSDDVKAQAELLIGCVSVWSQMAASWTPSVRKRIMTWSSLIIALFLPLWRLKRRAVNLLLNKTLRSVLLKTNERHGCAHAPGDFPEQIRRRRRRRRRGGGDNKRLRLLLISPGSTHGQRGSWYRALEPAEI